MAEKQELNIFQKLQKARVELQKKNIKKSGNNSFSHYTYMELKDFLPHINEICDKLGLYNEFIFDKKETEATLTVFNSDKPEEKRVFKTPIVIASLKGATEIQNVGATETYCKRYLYTMAYEIAETDLVDSMEQDLDRQDARKKIAKPAAMAINKQIEEYGVDKPKFLQYFGIKKVEDLPNERLGECMKMLNKKQQEGQKTKPTGDVDYEF